MNRDYISRKKLKKLELETPLSEVIHQLLFSQ